MDSIQRAINSIRDGKDNGTAESALRSLCATVIRERDVTWVNLAEDLVSRRLSDTIKEEGLESKATERLAALESCRVDMDSLRGFLIEFTKKCSSFDICFLSAGIGIQQEMYRSREEGNVVEAIQRIQEYGSN